MSTEQFKFDVGDTVRFQYQNKSEMEGTAKIEAKELGGIYVTRIIEHPKWHKGGAVKLLEAELLEKIS
jgi:hypothetical protein